MVLLALYREIAESPLVGVRNGEWAPASPGVHRRSGRRWTRATHQKAVQNRGEEPSPRLCTVFARRSGLPSALGVELRREGCPSPAL